jgi:hypothetical protein
MRRSVSVMRPSHGDALNDRRPSLYARHDLATASNARCWSARLPQPSRKRRRPVKLWYHRSRAARKRSSELNCSRRGGWPAVLARVCLSEICMASSPQPPPDRCCCCWHAHYWHCCCCCWHVHPQHAHRTHLLHLNRPADNSNSSRQSPCPRLPPRRSAPQRPPQTRAVLAIPSTQQPSPRRQAADHVLAGKHAAVPAQKPDKWALKRGRSTCRGGVSPLQ